MGPKVFSIAHFRVLPSSTSTMAGARGGSQYAPSGLPGKGENMHQVRRLGVLGTLIAGVLAFGMVAALASASGQGQTPLSASLGFNAQADLSGQLDYVADPNRAPPRTATLTSWSPRRARTRTAPRST